MAIQPHKQCVTLGAITQHHNEPNELRTHNSGSTVIVNDLVHTVMSLSCRTCGTKLRAGASSPSAIQEVVSPGMSAICNIRHDVLKPQCQQLLSAKKTLWHKKHNIDDRETFYTTVPSSANTSKNLGARQSPI